MRTSQVVFVGLMVGVLGCSGHTPPPAPLPVRPLPPSTIYTPPDSYRVWHAELEDCLKQFRSFEAVEWHVVAMVTFPCEHLLGCLGQFVPATDSTPDRIYVVAHHLHTRWLVKHELQHYVIKRPGHPSPPFSSQAEFQLKKTPAYVGCEAR